MVVPALVALLIQRGSKMQVPSLAYHRDQNSCCESRRPWLKRKSCFPAALKICHRILARRGI